jgi:hypothetical protein
LKRHNVYEYDFPTYREAIEISMTIHLRRVYAKVEL